jgi:hypothetical protein
MDAVADHAVETFRLLATKGIGGSQARQQVFDQISDELKPSAEMIDRWQAMAGWTLINGA